MQGSIVSTSILLFGCFIALVAISLIANLPLALILPIIIIMLIIVMFLVVLFDKMEKDANDRVHARLKKGEYLVSWTYSPEEWRKFTASEGRRSPWIAFDHLLYAVPVLAAATIGVMLLKLKPSDTRQFVGIIAGCTILVIFVALARFVEYIIQHRRRLEGADKVYFTLQGVFQDGALSTLPNLSLPKIVPGNPSVLHLEGFRSVGTRSMLYTVRLAIPDGREDEAQTLIRFYQSHDTQERENLLQNLSRREDSWSV